SGVTTADSCLCDRLSRERRVTTRSLQPSGNVMGFYSSTPAPHAWTARPLSDPRCIASSPAEIRRRPPLVLYRHVSRTLMQRRHAHTVVTGTGERNHLGWSIVQYSQVCD